MKLTDLQFFESEIRDGVSLDNKMYLNLFDKVNEQLPKHNSILDIGCGVGALLATSKAKNRYGIEPNKYHRQHIKEHTGLKVQAKDVLNANYPKVDIASSIEVFEHLTDTEVFYVLENVQCKYFLFSSTSAIAANDQEWGHINIKPQSEWLEIFKAFNFSLEKEMKYPTSWTKLFKYEVK